jgi:hypothetical protein
MSRDTLNTTALVKGQEVWPCSVLSPLASYPADAKIWGNPPRLLFSAQRRVKTLPRGESSQNKVRSSEMQARGQAVTLLETSILYTSRAQGFACAQTEADECLYKEAGHILGMTFAATLQGPTELR